MAQYDLLASDVSEQDTLLEKEQTRDEAVLAKQALRRTRLSRIYDWIILLFLLADIAICLYVAKVVYFGKPPVQAELEYRNPYINLENLYKQKNSTTRYKPIQNPPRSALQISSTAPESAVETFPQKLVKQFGTISPPDKHLKVDALTHTILQYRSIDFGMEKCTLRLLLPASRDETLNDFSVVNGTNLDVCLLNLPNPRNIGSVTWKQAPSCSYIGSLLVKPGGESTLYNKNGTLSEFSCPWGSWYTFRVSCSSLMPSCNLDVWSDDKDKWGINMYQFQTV